MKLLWDCEWFKLSGLFLYLNFFVFTVQPWSSTSFVVFISKFTRYFKSLALKFAISLGSNPVDYFSTTFLHINFSHLYKLYKLSYSLFCGFCIQTHKSIVCSNSHNFMLCCAVLCWGELQPTLTFVWCDLFVKVLIFSTSNKNKNIRMPVFLLKIYFSTLNPISFKHY